MSYIHSKNEHCFTNVNVTGSIASSGQLRVQRQEMGPVVRLVSKNLCKNDLIKIEKYNGDEIFRIGCDGNVFVNGTILSSKGQTDDANVVKQDEQRREQHKRDDIVLERNGVKWKIAISDDGNLLFLKSIDGNWIERHCVN